MLSTLAATIDKVEVELAATGELTKDDSAKKQLSSKQAEQETVTHHYRVTIDAQSEDTHKSGSQTDKSASEISRKKKRAGCWCFGKASK